jgi:chorismate mutase
MHEDLYLIFMNRISQVLRDKKFPAEDLARVFNILAKISAYQPKSQTENNLSTKFMSEIVGKMKHSINDVP